MTELITALAAFIAAVAAVWSAIAAIISAVRSGRSETAAKDTKQLMQAFVTVQQQQRQDVHIQMTAGSVTVTHPAEIKFPDEAVPPEAEAAPNAPTLLGAEAELPPLARAPNPPEQEEQ